MSSITKTEQLLRNALSYCGGLYKLEMEGFYPRAGLIDESNLVRLYIEALKRLSDSKDRECKPKVYAWTEYLNGKGKRFDAVIKINDDLVILEAKRIKQGKRNGVNNADAALKSIYKDSERLFKTDVYQPVLNDLGKRSVFTGDIYRVLISAIWLYKDPSKNIHMDSAKTEWLRKGAFSPDWRNAYTAEVNNIDPKISKKSELGLLLAIAK